MGGVVPGQGIPQGCAGARRPLAGLRRTAEAEERLTALATALFDGPPGVEL